MPQAANFHIPALDCPDELLLIERSLRRTQGIAEVAPDYLARNLRVEFDGAQTDAQSILNAIQTAGFPAQIALPLVKSRSNSGPGQARRFGVPIAVVIGGLLLLAAALIEMIFGERLRWLTICLTIASTIVSGLQVARAAWRAVRLRALDMNVLMVLAATGAIAIADYFEAATAMLLFAVSLWLERISLERAQRATSSLLALAPNVAHRMKNSGIGDGANRRCRCRRFGRRRPGSRAPWRADSRRCGRPIGRIGGQSSADYRRKRSRGEIARRPRVRRHAEWRRLAGAERYACIRRQHAGANRPVDRIGAGQPIADGTIYRFVRAMVHAGGDCAGAARRARADFASAFRRAMGRCG